MSSTPTAGGRRPNVLVIMTDQHRANLMSCTGETLVPTPNIDRIAAAGVRFENAYCPYPVCAASRASLLTGLYAHNTGVIDNSDRLDWRFRTVAHHFAASGYLTALIGKMHFNHAHSHGFAYYMSINDWLMYLGPKVKHYADEIANHPLSPNFFKTVYDTGAGFPDMDGLWDGPSPWVGNVTRRSFEHMASALEADDHLDMFVARESVKFMRAYRDQPFLLVCSFMKPHTPFYPPRAWAEKYPVDQVNLPAVGDVGQYPPHIQARIRSMERMDEGLRRAGWAGYLGNLAFVDTCVGHVYSELEALGLREDTIVVYTSDHGEMGGEHGLFQKFCLFEPAARIPLIISHPGHVPAGRVTQALTEYLGLYPTLANLAGTPAPDGTSIVDFSGAVQTLDGKDFSPIVRDPAQPGPAAVFSEFGLKAETPSYMIRTRRYKMIYHQGSTHELYDLGTDPGETRNLAADPAMGGVLKDLQEQLFAWYDPRTNRHRRAGPGVTATPR